MAKIVTCHPEEEEGWAQGFPLDWGLVLVLDPCPLLLLEVPPLSSLIQHCVQVVAQALLCTFMYGTVTYIPVLLRMSQLIWPSLFYG